VPWTAGSTVVVRTLGNKQGVVTETGGRGRYRVRVEGLTMWCREEDLAAVPERKKKHEGARSRGGEPSRGDCGTPAPERDRSERAERARRVDLHGFTVEEALARVDEEINQALLLGADRLEVVHGRGTGRIRNALHRHLASMPVVAAFRLDPGNPGVTWIHF
jgi:DNA mismatch repair protein MutS2